MPPLTENRSLRHLPLTIGLVGHRKIADWDVERVRTQVKEVLTGYKKQFPLTPIVLFTALAEGADQIAAEVGLEIDDVFVVALLPMSSDEYEKDFDSEEKLFKYRSLLNSCYRVIEAQLIYSSAGMSSRANSSLEFSVETIQGRDMAYRDCGRLISQQSHVLIAAWDGEFSPSVAGTADTITHRLKPSERIPLTNEQIYLWPQENGILLHIPSARVGSDGETQIAVTDNEKKKIMLINPDFTSTRWDIEMPDSTAETFEWINSLICKSKSGQDGLGLLSNRIREVADIQATRLHSRFRLLASSLLIFGVLSLFSIDLQYDFSSAQPYFLAIGFLLLTVLLWTRFAKGKLKDTFYQLRTLTEGMRVQTVWIECGINDSPSDDYLKGIPDVSWIPRAMRSAWFVDNLPRLSGRNLGQSMFGNPIEVVNAWLEGQINYFDGTSEVVGAIARSQEKYRRYERISIFGIAIAVACVLWDGLRFLPGGITFPNWVADSVQLSMHLGLSVSAASATYSQLMAFREIKRQYEISERIFKRGVDILKREAGINTFNREHLSAIVMQVGKEALRETGTWLALKRDRAVHPI